MFMVGLGRNFDIQPRKFPIFYDQKKYDHPQLGFSTTKKPSNQPVNQSQIILNIQKMDPYYEIEDLNDKK